jgi:peptidoglycan/LPS O-acetylase OafA/YrhL
MIQNRTPHNKESDRQPSIDILRFIAAIMVATSHWGLEVGSVRYAEIYDAPVIGDLVKNGGFGVNIFFVISGFVIIGTAQKYDAVEFIFARFNRVLPMLFISMILVLIIGTLFIQPFEKPVTSFFHSIFLTYQVAGVQPLATPLWTLIIEVKFYAGVGLALFILPKLFKSVKGIILLTTFWELTILILKAGNATLGTLVLPHLSLNGFYDFFILGICFNLLSKTGIRFNQENLLVWMVTSYFLYSGFLEPANTSILKVYMIITSIVIVFGRHIVLHQKLKNLAYLLGLSSYPIYLLHLHLGTLIILQLQSRIMSDIFLVIGTTVALISLFSIFLANFLEKPMQRFFKSLFQKLYSRG